MYRAIRPLAFRLDAERAHHLALRAARLGGPVLRRRPVPASAPVEAFGIRFPNPIGLAAGYDKDAVAWREMGAFGFGHIEVGTVTPLPQPGNPRPRVTRIPSRRALVNRMGFPSDGAEAVAARLSGRRHTGLILGVSIGPNRDTPAEARIDDYLGLVDRFAPIADYLAINVSSPNTPGLRDLEAVAELSKLLASLVGRRDTWVERAGRPVPLLVKLSPDLGDFEPVVRAIETGGADGIIMGNTTISRPEGVGAGLAGGVSGAPLEPIARTALIEVLELTSLPVVASGGIVDVEDALDRLALGAALVQLYTGLIYAGPGLPRRILRHLERRSRPG